jgi:hypothetical protein
MLKRLMSSRLARAGKRGLAVVMVGLLLSVLAAPATSSAAPSHGSRFVHATDGVGDSPLVP